MTGKVAFIFDMDGVMVDNHAWHLKAWMEFCRRHGIEISEADFYSKLFGGNNATTLEHLFNRKFDKTEIRDLGNEKEAIYRELYKSSVTEVPGLRQFIVEAFGQGIPLAVASSAPAENIGFTLFHLDLEGYFEVIVHGDMVGKGKPDPGIYLRAAELLGTEPGNCLVFEDSVPGIQSALHAGMKVIGLTTTLPPEKVIHTSCVIPNFAGITVGQAVNILLNPPKQAPANR